MERESDRIKFVTRSSFRFVTIHAFVRQTDGRTLRLHSMQRGKNVAIANALQLEAAGRDASPVPH